jgi:tetratricopeptide (TPR) repeat protein
MKINSDPTPYSAATAAKDADFWDWYTRRLLDDPMYRRDFAGQKSFSKLRAAIAGLYMKQGRYREGAQAFREACLLYPASPEATFRYSQESLMPFRKWDIVLELMDYTDKVDPNNRRTANLRGYVERVRTLTSEIERLETKRRAGSLDDRDTLALAQCYFEIGRAHEAAALLKGIAGKVTGPMEQRIMAGIFTAAGLFQEAETALVAYLRHEGSRDAHSWADLAKVQHKLGRRQAAQQSFIAGYRIDAQGIFARIQKEQDLYEIAAPLFQRRK